ncbi:cupin domain-containing protein [Belliella kenyensis]|uniref:Cupin domain-containing protein n=1 Tax=Belliella kenyensis TaxID=1472724 RepID=A0ABV8ELP7_9BACT|nr:cupin domain-containing protein [Belliella kenyensis]
MYPDIVGELNENFVKLAKLNGELVWHSHQEEDEMFVVVSSTLMMDFRDSNTTTTKPRKVLIIPRSVEHRP